jgi:hypothetical protein
MNWEDYGKIETAAGMDRETVAKLDRLSGARPGGTTSNREFPIHKLAVVGFDCLAAVVI